MIFPGFVKCTVPSCSKRYTAMIDITFKSLPEPNLPDVEIDRKTMEEINKRLGLE